MSIVGERINPRAPAVGEEPSPAPSAMHSHGLIDLHPELFQEQFTAMMEAVDSLRGKIATMEEVDRVTAIVDRFLENFVRDETLIHSSKAMCASFKQCAIEGYVIKIGIPFKDSIPSLASKEEGISKPPTASELLPPLLSRPFVSHDYFTPLEMRRFYRFLGTPPSS